MGDSIWTRIQEKGDREAVEASENPKNYKTVKDIETRIKHLQRLIKRLEKRKEQLLKKEKRSR